MVLDWDRLVSLFFVVFLKFFLVFEVSVFKHVAIVEGLLAKNWRAFPPFAPADLQQPKADQRCPHYWEAHELTWPSSTAKWTGTKESLVQPNSRGSSAEAPRHVPPPEFLRRGCF